MIWKIILGILVSIVTIFILAIFTNAIMLWNIYPEMVTGEVGNWIGFYATIIGGLLTLSGVFLTIQFNKNQIEKQNEKEKFSEEKNKNLNRIKVLWEIEMNLNSLSRDLKYIEEYIKEKIGNTREYAFLVNKRLNNEFFYKGLKPNKKQIEEILQEVVTKYVEGKFDEIKIQLQQLRLDFNKRNLQIKSTEIDWETYEYILGITEQLYEVCDSEKCITGPGSDELAVFKSECNLILQKISGMAKPGINDQIIGIQHKIKEKRKNIETKYFNESNQNNLT